jgi:hypothetical protein
MKLLRNPIVVGVLAVVAVVMVLYQVLGDKILRGRLFRSNPPAAPATSGVAKPTGQPAGAAAAANPAAYMAAKRAATYTNLDAALVPSQGVETAQVEPRFNSWVGTPQRDPFLLLAPSAGGSGLAVNETNSPVPTWALQAIWIQTGSRSAVVNGRVRSVGDEIEPGYRLIRIERDEVWFQGPNRNERLGFRVPRPMPLALPPTSAALTP